MNFTQLKEKIVKLAQDNNACESEFKRAKNSTSEKELLQVVKDNFSWCYSKKVITPEILDEFTPDLLIEFGIYYKGIIPKIENQNALILCGSVKVVMLGNSTVTEMRGNSTVTRMLGNSTVTEMWDNSTVTRMWGNSTVTEMWDNSTVTEMRGNSTVTEMWDNSTVTEMRGNSTVKIYGSNVTPPKEVSGNFCIINLNTKEIYCGKEFKIKQ